MYGMWCIWVWVCSVCVATLAVNFLMTLSGGLSLLDLLGCLTAARLRLSITNEFVIDDTNRDC